MATAILRAVVACAAAAALTVGCSGGGNDSGTGTLSVGITDAPVDFASSVVVTFSGVELKPHGGEAFSIDFAEDKTLDLLTLQGINRAPILDGETVPAGTRRMRLKVKADPDVAGDSYIQLEEGGAQCSCACRAVRDWSQDDPRLHGRRRRHDGSDRRFRRAQSIVSRPDSAVPIHSSAMAKPTC
jgi:hypothetical protein